MPKTGGPSPITADKLDSRTDRVFEALSSGSGGVAAKQVFFLGFVLIISFLLGISALQHVLSTAYLASIAVLTIVTIISTLVPWSQVDARWPALLPLANIVISGVMRDVFRDEAPAVTLLAFLPALWLAFFYLQPGTIAATATVTITMSLPTLFRAFPHIDSVLITRSMLIPLAVFQMCFMIALARKRALEERTRTEAALREKNELLQSTRAQEQLLKNIIDTVDIGIVVIDSAGKTILENDAYQQLQHFSAKRPGETAESSLVMRYPNTEITIPTDQRPLHRAADTETFKNNVGAYGGHKGQGRKISSSARQITDFNGERSGAVVVFADVTSYYESARRQHQFVAAVSHELRTPLTSIIGYLDLVIDGETLSETVSSKLGVVLRNAEQLLTIVEDLLGAQTVRDSGIDLSRKLTDLGGVTRDVCETVKHAADDKHININLKVIRPSQATADPVRMTQAVTNLMSNAIKYTPWGGAVTVTVNSNDAHVEISVADTGIGMSNNEQANLFTEYYRTATARNHLIPGHGLGLSITRLIVFAHSGQISVRSVEGRGSTFTIRIPAI